MQVYRKNVGLKLRRLAVSFFLIGVLFVGLGSAGWSQIPGLSVVQRGHSLEIVAQGPGVEFELYSLSGQKVVEGHSFSDNRLLVELPPELANGVYLYVATTHKDGRPQRLIGKTVVLRGTSFSASTPYAGRTPTLGNPLGGSIEPSNDIEPAQYSIPIKEGLAALRYWTPKRMRSAVSLTPMRPGYPLELGDDTYEPLREGAEISGDRPQNQRNESPPIGVEGQHLNIYPWPFTRYQIFTAYTDYPYRTLGKLFFTSGGQNFVCSAAVVTTGSGGTGTKRAVWTAGHCVNDGGSGGSPGAWHTNVVFVPAYKNGAAPLGTWPAKELWSLNGWINDSNFKFDLGAVVVNDVSGQRIGNVTGTLGISWNLARSQDYNDFGYPAAAPFTGRWLIVCQSWFAALDNWAQAGPATNAIGCDMTGGSSGGPWIRVFNNTNGGYINSVNSYKYDTQPKAIYGPYHGDGAQNLWNSIRNR